MATAVIEKRKSLNRNMYTMLPLLYNQGWRHPKGPLHFGPSKGKNILGPPTILGKEWAQMLEAYLLGPSTLKNVTPFLLIHNWLALYIISQLKFKFGSVH